MVADNNYAGATTEGAYIAGNNEACEIIEQWALDRQKYLIQLDKNEPIWIGDLLQKLYEVKGGKK